MVMMLKIRVTKTHSPTSLYTTLESVLLREKSGINTFGLPDDYALSSDWLLKLN